MFDPITAIAGISSLVGGGLGLAGSSIQAGATRDAASQQADAYRAAQQLQMQQYNQTRSDLAPHRQAGSDALSKLSALAANPFQFNFNQDDPGYQFRLKQGADALNASAASRGGYFSGGTGRALVDYGQGMASQEYQNAFNRALMGRQLTTSELSALAGMGQNAASMQGDVGANYLAQAGAAQAGGTVGAGNAWAGGLNTVNNMLQGGLFPALLYGGMNSSGVGMQPQYLRQNYPNTMIG